MNLGRVGVWSSALGAQPAGAAREAVAEIESLGYGALWAPEGVGGKELMSWSATLLAWSERLVIATGIANLYARDPMAMRNASLALSEAYPGRFLLGIGVSHAPSVAERGSTYGKPVASMRAYLDAMDAAPYKGVRPVEAPVVLAALGPKMLELSRERTDGAHPYFTPPEHTAQARAILGPGKLLLPEQAVLLETDPVKARAGARAHLEYYLKLDNYRNSLLRIGFTEEDMENGGSDRLADGIVAWGDVDAIAARVQAHLDAGADHVCIQPVGLERGVGLEVLRELAPALTSL